MELLNTKLGQKQIAELTECNVTMLPSVAAENVRLLPDVSAVYFLLFDSAVEYVGQSWRLRQRWLNHEKRPELRRPGARISYLIVPDTLKLRRKIEAAFIQRLCPQLNWTMRARPKTPTLAPRVPVLRTGPYKSPWTRDAKGNLWRVEYDADGTKFINIMP